MKITVMGLGYIGLPTAITLAEAGFEVCGFDVNEKTIETPQGRPYSYRGAGPAGSVREGGRPRASAFFLQADPIGCVLYRRADPRSTRTKPAATRLT